MMAYMNLFLGYDYMNLVAKAYKISSNLMYKNNISWR